VLDTGRNSVRPSTTPRIAALKRFGSIVDSLKRQKRPGDLRRPAASFYLAALRRALADRRQRLREHFVRKL